MSKPSNTQHDRTALLMSYVQRLSAGEDLETVRHDFIEHFRDVDAAEIAKAEQTLLKSGTPLEDVQRLCDVHSALFHGATKAEQIARAEEMVQVSLKKQPSRQQAAAPTGDAGGEARYQALCQIPGHPLQILTLENEAISRQLTVMRQALASRDYVLDELNKTRQIAVHYTRKGDLLYPLLKTVHGYAGPSDVMWSVDNEIRDDLRNLSRMTAQNTAILTDPSWLKKLNKVLTRAEEMVYKEDNILYPLCALCFTDEEWKQIGRDQQDFEFCLIPPVPAWQEAVQEQRLQTTKNGEVVLGSGHFTVPQLEAMLNTLPLEITFVDDQNINRYFSGGNEPKLFKRPLAALDREVFSCHPPKVQPIVRGVIQELKNGRASVDVWSSRDGEPVLIRYMAVRSSEGQYLGTVECVQRMGFVQKHFEAKK